jgi:hypothetical protein
VRSSLTEFSTPTKNQFMAYAITQSLQSLQRPKKGKFLKIRENRILPTCQAIDFGTVKNSAVPKRRSHPCLVSATSRKKFYFGRSKIHPERLKTLAVPGSFCCWGERPAYAVSAASISGFERCLPPFTSRHRIPRSPLPAQSFKQIQNN